MSDTLADRPMCVRVGDDADADADDEGLGDDGTADDEEDASSEDIDCD